MKTLALLIFLALSAKADFKVKDFFSFWLSDEVKNDFDHDNKVVNDYEDNRVPKTIYNRKELLRELESFDADLPQHKKDSYRTKTIQVETESSGSTYLLQFSMAFVMIFIGYFYVKPKAKRSILIFGCEYAGKTQLFSQLLYSKRVSFKVLPIICLFHSSVAV